MKGKSYSRSYKKSYKKSNDGRKFNNYTKAALNAGMLIAAAPKIIEGAKSLSKIAGAMKVLALWL